MLPGWWAGTRGEHGNPEVGTYPCPRGDRVGLASGHGLPAPWRVSGRGGGSVSISQGTEEVLSCPQLMQFLLNHLFPSP